MLKVTVFVVFLVLVCWPLHANAQTARPSDSSSFNPYAVSDLWFFNSYAVMDFEFARNATQIVVCQVRSSAVVEGVLVYRGYERHISGVKVVNLQVEQVIKGSGISPGTEIQALILPWVVVHFIPPGWDPQKVFEELRKTGKLPANAPRGWDPQKALEELRKTRHLSADTPLQEENYPEIADGQEGIFGLFPASFEDPGGLMMWWGAEKLNQGKPLFGGSAFFPMDVNHQEVKVLQRYLEISAIQDRQEQFRELAHFSLNLLRNPQTSPVIALGAASDATAAFPDARSLLNVPASQLEKQRLQQSRDHLDDQGLNELVQIAADPSRPILVRDKLIWAILQLVDLGRSIDLQPLFRVVEDSKDNLDIRSQIVRTLGDLDNPEVRKKFEQILSKDTSACTNEYDHSDICADKHVQNEIRKSRIIKQAQHR
ncbi:MAG: hypothetical protein PHX83_03125 [Acidobacteriia bacterium]|nr:hypothetical protein [Terriglobia bacterium]